MQYNVVQLGGVQWDSVRCSAVWLRLTKCSVDQLGKVWIGEEQLSLVQLIGVQ